MAERLARLKPDPLPQITTVPEALATGALKTAYEDTKAALGVPWMGVVTMAFAHYPTFYGKLWSGFAPVARSVEFQNACDTLRSVAENAAARLDPTPIDKRLETLGYSSFDLTEVRACNEVFSVGNMPYLLIATWARLLLEGCELPIRESMLRSTPARQHPRPALMEEHHATADIARLYDDIRATLALPFVNTDYRAFARWPSYFNMAWADLRPHVRTAPYKTLVSEIHDAAVDLAQSLPNPKGLNAASLSRAAQSDAPPGVVLDVVRLFQWLLPGLALNVAFFRHQLDG